MKILYTGFSSRECGNAKRELMRWDMNTPILESAARVGEVDRRKIVLGENLRQYDLIVMCLNQALSFNTRYGVLSCLYGAAQEDVPILMYVNDWQQKSWIGHLKSLVKSPEKTVMKRIGNDRMFNGETDEDTLLYFDAIVAGASKITEQWPANWSAVVPAFSWGDHKQFSQTLPMSATQYACADFSPFALKLIKEIPKPASSRERAWLLPSLSPQDAWAKRQKLDWPVNFLGSRKLKAERVSEQEVLNRVSTHAGTLSPKYSYLMGSGWWRIRYNYTALTTSIIAGDPAEAGPLGQAFQFLPKQIESMSDVEQKNLAEEQKSLMEESYWTLNQTEDYLDDVIRWSVR